MTVLQVSLSEERLTKLKELAEHSGVTPQQLLQASVEEWLGNQELDFTRAASYVVKKNAELYRRLAQCDS